MAYKAFLKKLQVNTSRHIQSPLHWSYFRRVRLNPFTPNTVLNFAGRSRCSYSQKKRPAFTLIEILVVVAIIAILSGILFPVFARARENARKTTCQSNLKQLGIGIMQYTQDYDDRYVSNSRTGSTADTSAISWTVAVFPYTKSRAILRCPSNATTVLQGYGAHGTTNTLNYTYNAYVGGLSCGSPALANTPGRIVSQIPLPSQTPLFVEAVGIPYGAGNEKVDQSLVFLVAGTVRIDPTFTTLQGRALRDPNVLTSATPPWRGDYPTGYSGQCFGSLMGAIGANVHFDGTNYLFADGHVKCLKSPAPYPGSMAIAPASSTGLDYCPDGNPGTATTYG